MYNLAMSAASIPRLTLSGGNRGMPVIGLGTAADSPGKDSTKGAVIEAIKVGYTHFDTASVCGSEEFVGEGIVEALQLGLINSRDDLFITSKLWCSDNHPLHVIPALQRSLRSLRLEYLDLYLIHFPLSAKPGNLKFPFDQNEVVPFDMKGEWAAMEECKKMGLTKSVGVSNFSTKKLQSLLSFATIPPSVNQVEMNPCWQQKKLREFCKAKGIIVTAYSPLGAKGASWVTNEVLDNELLKEVADAHGKTVAQVCLRWLHEQGVSFVVKSYKKGRMKQNFQVFDWSLTESDYQKIAQVKQHRMNHGPTTSLEDLFDGEA
ncbi:NAD(P)H-dependent 6'-deoxychalcone synthase-like [Prosopis cineraria]|uniref:NAD(P)H-dependent 6'-deoxychalcone synthase-like n=1 Tax=Prosopis cineraria TaxID=364024 RepID=UPI0024102830|nr:NAD(P)H-dependent 6'-deoxychalcone synthase-like [Prosopis cineraria]